MTPEKVEQARKLNEIAKARGQSLAQMALLWVLRRPVVTSALIGASSVTQLDENLDALKGKVDGFRKELSKKREEAKKVEDARKAEIAEATKVVEEARRAAEQKSVKLEESLQKTLQGINKIKDSSATASSRSR